MLPALVLFRPLWTEPARARCISSLRYPNAFWPECYRVPCFFYALAGCGFTPTKTERKCPVASDSGITRRPKIPIIFYCSGTIRAGRSCRSISRGRTSVFGPGSGGTPSRRTIRRGGRHRLSERHVQSRIPDAAGRHCAGSGP